MWSGSGTYTPPFRWVCGDWKLGLTPTPALRSGSNAGGQANTQDVSCESFAVVSCE